MTARARAGHSRRERRVRALVWALVALAVSVTALLAVATWALLFRPLVNVPAGRQVTIEVEQGSTTAAIGRELARAGVVDSEYMFRLRARLTGSDGALAPGVYDLTTGMRYAEVIELLRRGMPAEYVTVTIPEGFVLEQIAERLEARVDIPKSQTMRLAEGGAAEFAERHPYLGDAYRGSLEGYLFPKTYHVKKGATAREVLEMMLDQFDREIEAAGLAVGDAQRLNELVIVASIIEREAQLDQERPLVSSVIRNRLERGMALEIDATVEYVLPGNRFRLRYSDLRIDSPYNTYRYKGLPPGPISNPGAASLKAAAAPARTGYLYYVLTGKDGSHTFTTNKRDFLKAKQRSKEVFGR